MAKHLIFRYAPGENSYIGARNWKLIGSITALSIETAQLDGIGGYDQDVLAVFLIEDPDLGQFKYGGKLLSYLFPERPIAEQIQAMNDNPKRRHFNYIQPDAPLYSVRVDTDPRPEDYRAYPLYAWANFSAAPVLCDQVFGDETEKSIIELIQANFIMKRFVTGTLSTAADLAGVECRLGILYEDDTIGLDHKLDLHLNLRTQHDALEDGYQNGALYLLLPAVLEALMNESEEPQLDDFREAVQAMPSTPILQGTSSCMKKVGSPLLLIPDFGLNRIKIYTYYSYTFNHNYIYDLAHACMAAGQEKIVATPSDVEFRGAVKTLQIIPAHDYDYTNFFNEAFVQDRFLLGCILAGDAWNLVQLACPHKRPAPPLRDVQQRLELKGSGTVEQNYGGNFVISPPVGSSCGAIEPCMTAMGGCGPFVEAQPAAPFGKIVVGDCSQGYSPRMLDDSVRSALWGQCVGAQPWLPVDVSWLTVGHVDEVVSFIQTGSSGYKMIMPSTSLMQRLLALLADEDKGRNLFKFQVGLWGRDKFSGVLATREKAGPRGSIDYKEISVSALQRPQYALSGKRIQLEKLDPIKARLLQGLCMTQENVIEFPVCLSMMGPYGVCKANASTVNAVNMQMINGHLLIPRPFAPRVNTACAESILSILFERKVAVPPCTGFWHWCFPGEHFIRLALYYLPHTMETYTEAMDAERLALLTGTNWNDKPLLEAKILKEPALQLAQKFWKTIGSHEKNRIPSHDTKADGKWLKVWIPLPLVDIVETYITCALAAHGVDPATIHFIDSWIYHFNDGNVHCATNALSTPPPTWKALLAGWEEQGIPPFPYQP